uniref:Uncharacterized protein n=1 Tax=Oryza brachyantha TaxID=4533 RepID=J3LFD9_ORYBR
MRSLRCLLAASGRGAPSTRTFARALRILARPEPVSLHKLSEPDCEHSTVAGGRRRPVASSPPGGLSLSFSDGVGAYLLLARRCRSSDDLLGGVTRSGDVVLCLQSRQLLDPFQQ